MLAVNFQQCQIGLFVDANHLGIENLAFADRGDLQGRLARRNRQNHPNPLRSLYDMCVRHDVTIGIHDHPGSNCSLPHNQGDSAFLARFQGGQTGCLDLHHRRRNLRNQRLKRAVELPEQIRIMRLVAGSLRGWYGRTLRLLRQQLGGRIRRQTGEQQNTEE
jgi:hypothetical protein